jgi:serine/threonine-protein kinase RsbT
MAMKEGFSTASHKVREMGFGAGMGLANIKKNADKLDITSDVGKGTCLEITTFFK